MQNYDYVNKNLQHSRCAGYPPAGANQRLAQDLDSGACGALAWDQLGLRLMQVRLKEESAALCAHACAGKPVCAHVCIHECETHTIS